MITILEATNKHIHLIAPIFDQYRVFYKQDSDLKAAVNFLEKRLANNESILFLALVNEQVVGFIQLYPTFSSISLQPVFILNDLFVIKSFRKRGIGEALLNRVKKFCKTQDYKGLALETDIDNPAQRLYERMGWEKDSHCFHYFWVA